VNAGALEASPRATSGVGGGTGLPAGLPSRGELAWYQVARAIVYVPTWLLWRFRVVGRDNLPQTTPYVLAPSHRSYVDTLLVGCMTRRRVRFMAKSGVFENPFAARLFGSLGGFPVRRGAPDREALRNAESALAAGEPVVLYPEGGRRSGPVLGELLDGPAFLAVRANVPIVPVGIGGSEAAMPVGARWPRFSPVVLVVGRPIWPPALPDSGRAPRRVVQELTGRLRVELQTAFDRAQQLAEEEAKGARQK
jgi:1-acyl-sn-glycerol-3-phosphate acyltransferase